MTQGNLFHKGQPCPTSSDEVWLVRLTSCLNCLPFLLCVWPMKMALREKSALHAQVASLQKTNFDFARSKNILQAKVMKYAATVECTNEIELPYVEHMIVVLIALTLTCVRWWVWALYWSVLRTNIQSLSLDILHCNDKMSLTHFFRRLLIPLMPERPCLCKTSWTVHLSSLK